VRNAAAALANWGLRPEIGENALREAGRFGGSAEQRLSDLQRAFDDPEVRLVFCSRGGYGTVHLLDKLNFAGIAHRPKWVAGYSDITALHAALQSHGIASLHAPMARHFWDEGPNDAAVRYTRNVLKDNAVEYRLAVKGGLPLNRKGIAAGRLFGGNLSVFCGLLGSRYAEIPRGGILFIEDVGEAPYRVDRMIHQLKFAGAFDLIGGLIVGLFTGYEEDGLMYAPLRESILAVVGEYGFPVCFDFPAGHAQRNFPLIMGAEARLEVNDDFILFRQ
jgi:muramoyltetrapeptide carboxypeptidase